MLDLPKAISIKGRDGKMHDDVPMWTYLVPAGGHARRRSRSCRRTNDGKMPPVIHVDTDAPLYSDVDGSLITDKLWGIYYKPDFHFGGVQGGAMPYKVETRAGRGGGRSLRPGEPGLHRRRRFRPYVVLGAGLLPEALRGHRCRKYKKEPSGGIGCFTPDSFPVFDRVLRERLRHRRLQPRLQDDRRRQAGRRTISAARRARSAASRSASRASPRASCIRSRTARSRGADEHDAGRASRPIRSTTGR